MNVDIHAHYIPAESLRVAAEIGRSEGLEPDQDERGRAIVRRDGKPLLTSPKAQFADLPMRLSIMDSQTIDLQVLSPAGTYFFYWLPIEASLEFAQWLNERLAEAVTQYPKRFVALGSVPMQEPGRAVLELERAVTKLGLRGVEVASNVNGRYFDDPMFTPFWEAAQALDAIIFVHPNRVVGADRMKEFNLANLIGNPTDTSLTAAKLIFAGVLEHFPRLKILLAHAGGFLPYTFGRLDRGFRIQDSTDSKMTKPPSEYLKLLYFDTITHNPVALEYLVAHFGAEKVLLGSDYPYDMGDPQPLESLRQAKIARHDVESIAGANACKLFGIRI
jgi:aminocarboxymuconate-semialdehyde decarboxylase